MLTIRWSRGDGRLLEGILWVAFAVEAVFGLLLPALGVVGVIASGGSRTVAVDRASVIAGTPTARGVSLTGTDKAELTFHHPGVTERILLALPDALVATLSLLVIVLLIRMSRTLRTGDPFAAANVRRLSMIAVAIVLAGLLAPSAEAITTQLLVRSSPVAERIPFQFTVPFLPIVLGMLVAALAEVFRRGTGLRDDTEGLV